jgi:glucose-6-phosphate dehydrogenase assembly protein OpcA
MLTAMPLTEQISRGMPVEVSQINRSLSRLWEQESDELTKASLVNFAVYSEASAALNSNTQLMAQITREHACRVLLIGANPDASRHRVQAWISAHCHLSGSGSRQVCSEQIAFLIDGGGPEVVRNILFSHLDSDLPLYLWWQQPLTDSFDAQLWGWVDRFFFDSHEWRAPARQIGILRSSVAGAKSRAVLCDLNWRRLIFIRLAVARSFDQAWGRACLRKIRAIRLTYNPEFWTTAVLLVGWLASRLGWRLSGETDSAYQFQAGNQVIEVQTEGVPGPWISKLDIHFESGEFSLEWSGKFLEIRWSEHPEMKQLLPAGETTLVSLVSEELARGGEHRTYLDALEIAEKLW